MGATNREDDHSALTVLHVSCICTVLSLSLSSMHLDSHRLRFSVDRTSRSTTKMYCSKRIQAALQETETSEDGVKMYTWRAVRMQHLRALRKQTRTIVFFTALIEILRVGVVDMVYAGKHDTKAPGPEEYGVCPALKTSLTSTIR